MFSENRSYDGTHEQIYGACIKAISDMRRGDYTEDERRTRLYL